MSIHERARNAVAAYLQANGMETGDTLTMRLLINRTGRYCDVQINGGGVIRTLSGNYDSDVRWNRWTLKDFTEKVDNHLQALRDRKANNQRDMAVFRTLIERLEQSTR